MRSLYDEILILALIHVRDAAGYCGVDQEQAGRILVDGSTVHAVEERSPENDWDFAAQQRDGHCQSDPGRCS